MHCLMHDDIHDDKLLLPLKSVLFSPCLKGLNHVCGLSESRSGNLHTAILAGRLTGVLRLRFLHI